MGTGDKPPRRHHYVPQSSLRRFLGGDGTLWAYDLVKEKIYPANTKSVAFERDLYSITGEDGQPDHSCLEKVSWHRFPALSE